VWAGVGGGFEMNEEPSSFQTNEIAGSDMRINELYRQKRAL
jgi:hypothetical protein